jgi:hypothetical protein
MLRDEADEQVALIQEITQSPWFSGTVAKLRIGLLTFLFRQRLSRGGVSARLIAENVFQHLLKDGRSATDPDVQSTVRQAIRELQKALRSYALSESGARQKWRCELPKGPGYRLDLINQTVTPRLTLAFWRPHLEPRENHLQCPVVLQKCSHEHGFSLCGHQPGRN